MQVGENPLNRSGKPSYIKDEDIVSTLYESISSLNKAVICFFRQLTAADADKASSYCPGVNKCPYLKVYEKPEPVREYPSYFTPCC